MATLRHPIAFSEHFGIDPKRLAQRGTFDPVVNKDTALFVDPRLLQRSSAPQMQRGWMQYLRWFRECGRLLAESQQRGDRAWDAARKRFRFREPPATCLGHTVAGTKGRGIGAGLADQLLDAAEKIVNRDARDDHTKSVAHLPFLYRGFGPDRISDMVTQIVREELAEYTSEAVRELGVSPTKLEPTRMNAGVFDLPIYNKKPILLVPSDVLGELLVTKNLESLGEVVERNMKLRAEVDAILAGSVRVGADGWFGDVLKFADKGDPRGLAAFHAALTAEARPYDLAADPAGHLAWRRVLGIASQFPLVIDAAEPVAQAMMIVRQFERILREQDLSRWLFRGANRTELRPVSALRLLFFAVADSYCRAQRGGELVVEFETEAELTLFRAKGKTVLRIDVASSAQTNAKDRYSSGQHLGRVFLFLDHAGEDAQRLLALKNERLRSNQCAAEIVVVEL
jgi:hypothetical protein